VVKNFHQPAYLDELDKINDKYAKNPSENSKYAQELADLFKLKRRTITDNHKHWFAGMVEGEGSFNVSVKAHPTTKVGLTVDPEFSITQSSLASEVLLDALDIFKTGRISWKQGSERTLVYKITTRQTLLEKVCPFYETYSLKHASAYKNNRYTIFKELLFLMKDKKHLNIESFCNEILPLCFELRVQVSSKTKFQTLQDAQNYARMTYASRSLKD